MDKLIEQAVTKGRALHAQWDLTGAL